MDAAHWPRGPSAARAARPRPSPRLPPSSATRAHAATQAPPPPRTAPRNPDPGRRAPRPHREPCGQRAGSGLLRLSLDLHPPKELEPRTMGGLTVGSLHSLPRGSCLPSRVGLVPGGGRGTRELGPRPKRARVGVLGSSPRPSPPGLHDAPRCLPRSPASGAEGRNSAVHFPRGPNLSSVALGTPHPRSPAEGSTARKEPFPSGFCVLTEGIPRERGRVEVLFYFLIAHMAFDARLHRRHRLCYC